MKTVLIPTDFNLESLKVIDALVLTNQAETFKIVFIHAFKLSDSITDMLMLSRRSRDYEYISDEFYEQMNVYKEKFADQIHMIGVEYFYGSTAAAFRNFTENLAVDCIAYPVDYNFNPINKYSIDPKNLIERAKCEVLTFNINNIPAAENLYETKIPEKTFKILSV